MRVAVLALLLAAAAACGSDQPAPGRAPGPQDPGPPRAGGTAVIGIGSDLDSFNPYLSTLALTRDIAYHVFESLLEEQADFGQGPPSFLPALAVAWETAADGLEIRFHLRPDAVWSDGVPITADDVVFSYQASIDPDVAWIAADIKKDIETVEKIDDRTVAFRFSRVYPYQLMDANDGVILPRHVWGRVPFRDWRTAGLDRSPVSSGPFRVEAWVPNQTIELVRNERYHDPARPRLDRVVFRILPDAPTGLQQLLSGAVDFWDRIEPRDLPRLQAAPGVAVGRYPDRYFGFIGWNLRLPQFREATVRLALTLGINRQRIVEDLFLGVAQEASGPIPPLYWAFNRDLQPLPFDPDRAAALLDQAGWLARDGDSRRARDGVPLAFDLDLEADSALRRDMALMVQEDLGKLGVTVRINPLERKVANARRRSGRFDAFVSGWRLPTKVDLGVMFHSRSIETGVNFGGYSSSRLDALLDRADAAPDAVTAKPLFDAAQEILREDQPYTFLYWQDRLVGYASRLQDVRPNAQSPLFNLYEWWVPGDDAGN